MNNILLMETNKYAIKLDNFEGPLDLLCHLVDKNKMDIYKVNISKITDQYIQYINAMEKINLEIASEFILMASTLLYLKSRSLLPNQVEDESELTEEELIHRIIEYKKYKEISKTFKDLYNIYSKRLSKLPEKIELPDRKIEEEYSYTMLADTYRELLERNATKMNKNANNIEEMAMTEEITIASKVRDIFKELLKKPKFIFNKLCLTKKYTKLETVTAFTGLLELSRKNKVQVAQKKIFGDITVEKAKKAG
ncbi:MAG: segregation/condensation protein A [Firmicutes bacterium]|nr:segregation/condensation protein A [Bacillota bacterium]